jgi:hypothetical protein
MIERDTNFYSGSHNCLPYSLNLRSSIHYYTRSSSRVIPSLYTVFFPGSRLNLILLGAKDQTYLNIFLDLRLNSILLRAKDKTYSNIFSGLKLKSNPFIS